MNQWAGKVALVTGASKGIGSMLSSILVSAEMDVVGCARSFEESHTISQCKAFAVNGVAFHPVRCDVSKENEVKAMFDTIRSKFGRLDICINNAGILEYAPLMSGSLQDWRRIMEVNVLGTCICTRESIQLMQEKKIDGVIIQMCSIGGHKIASIPRGIPDPGLAMYNGTKFMIRALAESLRQELRSQNSGIRVSTVSAGPVVTEMARKALNYKAAFDYFESVDWVLYPTDVAFAICSILTSKPHVNVDDVIVQSVDFHV